MDKRRMKLKLRITKHYGLKYRSRGLDIRFFVIDVEKVVSYPGNFLGIRPKQINPKLR